jgi:hypothetical protein
MIAKVELFWSHETKGNQTFCTFVRGLIYLREEVSPVTFLNNAIA